MRANAFRELRQRGQRLIVIDPRRTETASLAAIHLQPRPGHDSEILASMLHVILSERRFDEHFVSAWATGLEVLREAVAPFVPSRVAAIADVPVDDIVAAARLFAAGPRGCAVGGTGLNMAPHPVLAEYLLLCLNTLCGRYRRAGEPVPNQGVLTAGRALEAGARRPRRIWGDGPQPRVRGLATMYGQMPASALADEILAPGDGQIRALIVSGGNPLVALPDHQKAQQALRSLDLLVSLDVRLSQTARLADYVIGCRLSLEKMDTTLASDLRFPVPFAQFTPAVREPGFDVIEEWEFFWALAQAMGTPWDLNRRVGMPIPLDASGDLPAGRKPTALELWQMLCASSRVPLDELRRHPHGISPALPPVRVLPPRADNIDRLELADAEMLRELDELDEIAEPNVARPYRLIARRMWEFHNSWGQNIDVLRPNFNRAPRT